MKENTCESLEINDLVIEAPITSLEYNNILNMQNKILSMLASHEDTEDILASLCNMAEESLPNSVASIMMQNEKTKLLSVLCAPSIPEVGHKALQNLKPGPGGGSCGNAVFHNEAQYVVDTFTDPRWEDLRQVAIDFNLCSCWSMPIRNQSKSAIGTFALSSFEHRAPSEFHKKLLEMAASIVNMVFQNEAREIKHSQSAFIDNLTQLPNKVSLEKRLNLNGEHTLVLLNINNFSFINTAYGLDLGDKLLIKIASIFKKEFSQATFFRINSDEFGWLFDDAIKIESEVAKIKDYFYNAILIIDNIKLNISFTYGAAYGVENLLRDTSASLKRAKRRGRNTLDIFDKNRESMYVTKRFIEANAMLFKALNEDQIIPFYQGIRDNLSKKIKKFEVLARIEIDGKIISPYEFLEPAKLSGVLFEITKIMIDKSFKEMSTNDYTFSINITEDDLSREYLKDYLEEKSLEYSIEPKRVILEILEGISSDGKASNIVQLSELKEQGYSLAIDDFGSEYSNFERVLDLDIDFLKIDAKYIKDIHTNKKSYEVTRAIVFFAKNAKIPCIAEFVHNEEVQAVIDELDINFSQGFYFSEAQMMPIGDE